MATALGFRHRTLAEFLAWEEQQADRYEWIGGHVRMMTGGTIDHGRITRNVALALHRRLQGRDCEVFTSDIKVVSPEDDVMYPDVLVACGELPGKATRLEAPVVVVEVLSESTAARDHGRKRWAYQTIASLSHLVLIDQSKPVVEVSTRADDGSWRSVIQRGLEGRAQLTALGIEIGLDEIFARVDFAGPEADGEQAPPAGTEREA
jgi:Uma2 family endonuclease